LKAWEAGAIPRAISIWIYASGMASMVEQKPGACRSGKANGESRFVMLETIREYGLDKLHASGEEALTRRAHAAYCLVAGQRKPPRSIR